MVVQNTRASRRGGPISDLIASVKAGGVTIETEYGNQPKHLACRTVVQLDGDMMVYVDPKVESDSPEWRMHERETKTRIRRMAIVVRRFTNGLHLCIFGFTTTLVYFGGRMCGLDTTVYIEIGGPIVSGLVLQLGLTRLFPQVAPRLLGWLLSGISRRLKRLAGFEQREDFLRRTT